MAAAFVAEEVLDVSLDKRETYSNSKDPVTLRARQGVWRMHQHLVSKLDVEKEASLYSHL
jgi:hypothetical protein